MKGQICIQFVIVDP